MIKAEKLSYGFPQKDLYTKITFTIEEDQHCALIGTNGTGKSTLIDMIRDPEKYMYTGKLKVKEHARIGYVSQFSSVDTENTTTVFEYLSAEFVKVHKEINRICDEMEKAEDLVTLLEHYQEQLDLFDAMDGEHYESNIRKQLKTAGLEKQENLAMGKLSGGEYKLVQIMKEMIVSPDLLIMDEPDGFLDFENLNGLRDLINAHKGTMLVISHNRYLLNHCFNKILHLENTQIQEFDGTYVDYNFTLLQTKIELQELNAKDEEEIARNRKVVERYRADATKIDNATKGRALKARVSLLERLEARKIKAPFVEIKQPQIHLSTEHEVESEKVILKVENYSARFDELLLEDVNFLIQARDKVAIVGPNGTGKTTMLRDIYKNENTAIEIPEEIEIGFLSQLQGEMLNEENTVVEEFEQFGFENEKEVREFLSRYCFEEDILYSKISALSGGEKNILQLAKLAVGNANLLLFDEPTSHLDLYAQVALEQAINEYNGGILMVSHDFYTIANTMDYVLFIEDGTVRKMSIRKFRKRIYANHFDKDYLEIEQKKKELELRISAALKHSDFELAKELSEKLGAIIVK